MEGKMKKFRISAYILFIISLFIKYISSKYSYLVENYYSKKLDIYIVKFLSKINSTFDFSYFEILIYIFVLSILISIIYLAVKLFKDKKSFFNSLKNILLNYLAFICFMYFLFIVLWGINYNRVGLEESIKTEYKSSVNKKDISNIAFDKNDLEELYSYLIEKCNESKKIVNNSNNELNKDIKSIKNMISTLQSAYDNVELLNLNKQGNYSKAKIILNSNLLSYTSITGIYSPFTGEANININQPLTSMPFTILHEMAHQRGYANESEANFLAYIACIICKLFGIFYGVKIHRFCT